MRTHHMTLPRLRRLVATHYFPAPTPRSSVVRLRRWIAADLHFREELLEAGYRPRQRIFTPRQMDIVRKYLGAW